MDFEAFPPPSAIPKKRRTYSDEFKFEIIKACEDPSASIASVALQNVLNANLISRWIKLFKPDEVSSTQIQPAFISVPFTAEISASKESMVSLQLKVPKSNNESN